MTLEVCQSDNMDLSNIHNIRGVNSGTKRELSLSEYFGEIHYNKDDKYGTNYVIIILNLYNISS